MQIRIPLKIPPKISIRGIAAIILHKKNEGCKIKVPAVFRAASILSLILFIVIINYNRFEFSKNRQKYRHIFLVGFLPETKTAPSQRSNYSKIQ
jgi:hypothetical protein